MASVDFARVFYYGMVLDGWARNGALRGQLTASAPPSQFTDVQAAGLADANANGLTLAPTVAVDYGSTPAGPFTEATAVSPGYVRVTVKWKFETLVHSPGIPSKTDMERVWVMPVAAAAPVFN